MRVVQRTPDLGIGIKLQRFPAAPEATPVPCPCAPETVGWLVQPTPGRYMPPSYTGTAFERQSWILPMLDDAYITDADGRHDTNTAGRVAIMRIKSLPAYGDFNAQVPGQSHNPHQSWMFLAAPFGDAQGIRWEWDFAQSHELPAEPANKSEPWIVDWWAGYNAEQVGQFLQVRIKHGHWDQHSAGTTFQATLTARAYCGDAQVGELLIIIDLLKNQGYPSTRSSSNRIWKV